jgi:hypothetical protein
MGMLSRPLTQAFSHCVNSSIVPLIGWVSAPPISGDERLTLNWAVAILSPCVKLTVITPGGVWFPTRKLMAIEPD